MAVPPSLHLLFDVVASELAAQEQRGEALDSKAGVVLGFAGVLVGLTLGRVNNASEVAGLVAANTAAVLSAAT